MASVDELPPCPRDLPEPTYAALLFSPYCSVSNGIVAATTWADDVLNIGVCETTVLCGLGVPTEVL